MISLKNLSATKTIKFDNKKFSEINQARITQNLFQEIFFKTELSKLLVKIILKVNRVK